MKNKFGFRPIDIAHSAPIRKLFVGMLGKSEMPLDKNQSYGREEYNGVLIHNDRLNKVQNLMHKYKQVDKFLKENNHNEEELIKRLEE